MSEAPGGTVTFLFTDIEGSTQLWERDRAGMSAALARHDAILRGAITDHGGHVFKTVGDAFCAAFDRPAGALGAALAAQRGLLAADWPALAAGPTALRVRMALHSGTAEERDNDYFGPALNRVARLLAIASGGQVVTSLATEQLLRDQLTDGVGLLDLGEHRLKDLVRPERVFQVTAPGLPADFAPLRSIDAFRHNLPIRPTAFIGREQEIATLHRHLAEARLVTITGAGGSGKTRLAQQVGAELLEVFPDGVWFADLAPLANPALVPAAVAAAMSVPEQPGRPFLDVLADALRQRQDLLILDNCEHVVDAAAALAERLLSASSGLRILATSREALRIEGELSYVLPTLAVPPAAATDQTTPRRDVPDITSYEAVRLFVARATEVAPTWSITGQNAAAVAAICRQLDGIPLAIELAAARIPMLSADAILARLDDRFRLLVGGRRTALPRQQTLLAAVEWSHELLEDDERVLFRRLSVFAGGWSLAAAEAVCGEEPIADWQVLDLLDHLAAKSLVLVDADAMERRYRMLETIQAFAGEQLARAEEADAVRGRHADWYLDLAMRAEPEIDGEQALVWLERLETELSNIRGALTWLAETGRVADGLRLAGALQFFWCARGHIAEGNQYLVDTLAIDTTQVPEAVLALAHEAAGTTYFQMGRYDEAIWYHEAAFRYGMLAGDVKRQARSLKNQAMQLTARGDFRAADDLFGRSALLFRAVSDHAAMADLYHGHGAALALLGSPDRAMRVWRTAVDELHAVAPPMSIAGIHSCIAEMSLYENRLDEAWLHMQTALDLTRHVPLSIQHACAQLIAARILRVRGEFVEAARRVQHGVLAIRDAGLPPVILAGALCDAAAVLQGRQRYRQAAILYGASDAAYRQLKLSQEPPEAQYFAGLRLLLRGTSDPATIESALATGHAMDLDTAVAFALAELGDV